MSTYQSEQFPLPTPGRLRRELRLPRPPWWLTLALIAVVIGTWFPLWKIYQSRNTYSADPRRHLFLDMDKQPRRGPQTTHSWFLDGRAMRLPVEGTIARGALHYDTLSRFGYLSARAGATESVEFATAIPDGFLVVKGILARGQDRYKIYCALCHGDNGLGDGAINQRAVSLKEPNWVPAANLMLAQTRDRKDGELFQALSDGIRNMPGHGSQITVEDRWAIVAWLREMHNHTPVETGAGIDDGT